MTLLRRNGLLAACALLGCEGQLAPGDAPFSAAHCGRIVSMELSPPDASIEVGDSRTVSLEYRALATFEDGTVRPVRAAFWLDTPGVGAFTASGAFAPSTQMGALATLHARANDVRASTSLNVKLVRRYFAAGSQSTDAHLFDDEISRSSSIGAPVWESPEPDTWLTASEPPVFAWSGPSRDVYRLRFQSGASDMSVYARGSSVTLPDEAWAALTASNRGRFQRVTLEAAGEDDESVHVAERPVRIGFCAVDEWCDGTDDDCNGTVDNDCAANSEPQEAPPPCD